MDKVAGRGLGAVGFPHGRRAGIGLELERGFTMVGEDEEAASDTVKLAKPKTWYGRWLLRGLIMNAVLFGSIAAYYCEERWRGERAWTRYQAEAKARGTRLTLAEFIRPPIKDEDNFAAIPLFQDMFDTNATSSVSFSLPHVPSTIKRSTGGRTDFVAWRDTFVREGFFTNATAHAARDVLEALKVFDADLAQLRAAASRPDSRFPVNYHKGSSTLFPHVSPCLNLARLLRLRIAAGLAEGESEQALDDFKLGLRIHRALEHDSSLISGLVGIGILAVMEDAAHAGIDSRIWTAGQIAEIQGLCEGLNPARDCDRALQSERALCNSFVEEVYDWKDTGLFGISFSGRFSAGTLGQEGFLLAFPRGWIRLNQVAINRYFDADVARIDPKNCRFSAKPTEADIRHDLGCDGPVGKYFYFMVNLLTPAVDKAQRRFAVCAAQTEAIVTACALERHRMARGSYPERLVDLVPEFLAKVPLDPVDGKPLRYERSAPVPVGGSVPSEGSRPQPGPPGGGYVLWSPDLEHKLSALSATNAPPPGDAETESWVWRQPPN